MSEVDILDVQVLMISAKQGGGKSTVADNVQGYLVNHGAVVARFKFADVIYELHDLIRDRMRAFNYPIPDKNGDWLQWLGDMGRAIDPDIWANITRQRINEWKKSNAVTGKRAVAIIDDCRFKNEFDFFEEAMRVRLTAPEEIRKLRTKSWRNNTQHKSEIDLDEYAVHGKFDLYFQTDGTHSLTHIVNTVVAELNSNNWIKNRK